MVRRMKIADFHCDLLSYLAGDPTRTVENPESRASVGQMRKGGIVLQTLAVFTETKAESTKLGEAQLKAFESLKKRAVFQKEIYPLLAVENASGFCEEFEPLEKGLKRLERWLDAAGSIGYISFTWNQENRFGGGNASDTGIKADGERLLEWMEGKKIAIDLSHTSDALAHDILNTIDEKGLTIIPVASHSNFRSIVDHPRNLPDEIAQEIFKRKGVVGLNFVRPFLGTEPEDFLRQIEHAEKLGGLNHLCFGADFFYDGDSPPELDYLKPFFLERFDDASCYPRLIELLRTKLTHPQMEKISHLNLLKLLKSTGSLPMASSFPSIA
ncbi:MAG TPA: membrane dipeptidase [Chlamydiales bacterium]|nr:membrane dipeptidase [Chlamydiales bacterium]